MSRKQLTRIEELERDIALHEATLADSSNIKSGFHRTNVQMSLDSARQTLKVLKNE